MENYGSVEWVLISEQLSVSEKWKIYGSVEWVLIPEQLSVSEGSSLAELGVIREELGS
jgi:hypothetical protein